MTATCKKCGKPLVNTRAGSFTSYLFQQNYCQCDKNNAGRQSNQTESTFSQVCTCCGKSVAKKRAGSFTSFLFQELRCQCAQPALPKKERLARTNTQVRRRAMAEKRGYTAGFKANAESGRKLPQADFSPGTVIGGVFKIVSVIGEGGMGIVYLAQHLSLNRAYALKVLSPSIVSEQSWLRFKAEAKTLSVLNHPGLVKVYDLGIHENTVPYYSMDYLEGETLEDLLVRKGPQKLEFTISIFLAVLDALAYAHRNNVVHRDIKPANIFICQSQEIKILDFGISKLVGDKHSQRNQELTAVGEVFGSPFYMSPEQCRGEQVDFRSDIYSVGCALFETLTGYIPFESANSLEIAMLHEEGEIPLLSDVCDITFPPSLDVVIAKCLAKLPQDRYQSAKEMAIDLTRIKEGKNLEAYAHSSRSAGVLAGARSDDSLGTGRIAYGILALLGLSLAGGMSFLIIGSKSAVPEASVKQAPVKSRSVSARVEMQEVFTRSISKTGQDLEAKLIPKKLDRPTELAVQAYLKSAPRYYSKIVRKEGRELKVFDFPKTFSLGELTCSLDLRDYAYEAKEKIGVPLKAAVLLNAGPIVQIYPALLNYFRSDDLTSLTLTGTAGNAEQFLSAVSRLTALGGLSLYAIPLSEKNVEYLNGLTKLRSFTLRQSKSDPAALSKLLPLSSVERVSLDGGANLSGLLKVLSRNSHLVSLEFGDANLSKSDVAILSSFRSLENLSIDSSSIDNGDLEVLTALPKLKRLILYKCCADEKCIKSLKKFRNLTYLNLVSVNMPKESRDELQDTLPQLKVMQFSF